MRGARGARGGGGGRPFIMNTRQRFQPSGPQIAIPAGGNAPFAAQAFYQVGLAGRLLLHVRVLTNIGATPMAAAFKAAYKGPWQFLRNISLDFNLGSTNIIKSSGFALACRGASTQMGAGKAQSNSTVGQGTGRDPFFNLGYNGATFAAANAVVPFEFVLELPIAGNDGFNFTLGLINLQSPEVQLILSGQFGQLTDLISNASATQTITGGYVQPYVEYYEIPPPKRGAKLPPLIVHRLYEDLTPVTSVGQNTIYQIARQGKLLRLLQFFDNVGTLIYTGAPQLGSAAWLSPVVPGVDNWQVVANITDTVYNEDYIVRRWREADEFGDAGNYGANVAPTNLTANPLDAVTMYPTPLLGAHIWEFWNATGLPARGNFRDVLDAEALTTLQFLTFVDAAVALNAGAYLSHLREFWQPLSRGALGGGIGR